MMVFVLFVFMLPFILFCLWGILVGIYAILDQFTDYVLNLKPRLFSEPEPKKRGKQCRGK